MTKLRRTFSRTFSVCHYSVTRRLSNLGPGGRVRSPRVRGGVDLGGRGRGRRGGVFPETTLNFLDSLQTRPDPTRPRPRSPIFISYPPTRPPPTRPHTGEWRRAVLGAFHIGSLGKVYCVRCLAWTCNVGAIMIQNPVTVLIKIPCGSRPTDESLDPISKSVNWS